MRGIYDGYEVIGEHGDEVYFIGANTGRGFINASVDALSEGGALETLYILKGGAGTGKSTFLKKTAKEAKKRGYPVVLYRCGSDWESLDAVVIDGRIGVVDGTSPHVWEMKVPGAASFLIDVSKYLSSQLLAPHKDELVALTRRKAESYASAYRYLKAAELLENEVSEAVERAADWEKLHSYAERTAKKISGRIEKGKAPSVTSVYTGSISMRGFGALPTLKDRAEQIISVKDVHGFASAFLRELGTALVKRGLSVVYGRIPLNDKIRELYVPEIGFLFSVNEGEYVRRINLERFLRKEQLDEEMGRLKLTERCIQSLLDEAVHCLAEAGAAHFGLEQINKEGMDFKGLNRYCTQMITDIMTKLTPS